MGEARTSRRTRQGDHATVMVVLEGARSDFVSAGTMPFLNGLARHGVRGSLAGAVGWDPQSVLFTGLHPDTTGAFLPYSYDPQGSPFRWVRGLGPIARLARPVRVWAPGRALVRRVTRWFSPHAASDPAWLPPRFLPFMKPRHEDVLAGGGSSASPTVFDLCRAHALDWQVHDARGVRRQHAALELVRAIRSSSAPGLSVLRSDQLHAAGHRYGPNGQGLWTAAGELDDLLAGIHAALGSAYDSWDLMVCGDRGMAPIEHRLDIMRVLKGAGMRPGEDYLSLVKGPMMSLWYRSRMARPAIERLLRDRPEVRLVEDEERRRLRLPMEREWGDRLVVGAPGVVFEPDHTRLVSHAGGMHGTLDARSEGDAALVLASSRPDVRTGEVGRRPMVDVMPSLCGLLGIRAPPDGEGEAFLRLRRDPRSAHLARSAAGRPLEGQVVQNA